MGTITRFNMPDLVETNQIRYFVETGTGTGDGVAYAAINPNLFHAIYSCEIEPTLALQASARFDANPNIRIFNEPSLVFLTRICEAAPETDNILFWLDAHFPGADYGIHPYAPDGLPLEQELKIIRMLRSRSKDVIIADDLRIYLDGPFGHGNLPDNVRPFCPTDRSIDFVYDIMGRTHEIRPLYEHEGYIVMTPKS
jgi:hypothetical protein